MILHELATGRLPFSAESLTDLALRIAMDPTPPLRGTPPGFERVIHRCLEKDPARRFQDVGQLATALAPFGGPTLRERALGVMRGSQPRPAPACPPRRSPWPPRRPRSDPRPPASTAPPSIGGDGASCSPGWSSARSPRLRSSSCAAAMRRSSPSPLRPRRRRCRRSRRRGATA